jgi:signal transduction histidine kinase
MLSQINNSLELRKVEDGSYTFQAQPCNPAKIIQDNFEVLALSGYANNINLNFTERTPVTLRTDCLLFDSIISNLLHNAIDASDAGFPVSVELSEEMETCVITIANNRAVPEEIRQRFFEKYITAKKSGGTGLGTYSAFIMTRAIGGNITMETSEQFGTKVTIRIPLGKD